ncbi:hypothetical protein P152DRAFT_221210 [Eremomyces bilateralis CBS 781.70]|uniref:C2H2-type domain-containing protein n=1 Tax=Eremomyces bilateralis CBS 781.70 TaxID=1392243 RepID=A0A6G1FRR2_9PEZI|nr:uncharacterized protein P152DRAFT_221210 [Eremomyces bilateralis CBS 781.70]KAF1808416.1 hypothetical protein P152DRAFT_221210 [Eremomyces bilateralis CBS 781.70]
MSEPHIQAIPHTSHASMPSRTQATSYEDYGPSDAINKTSLTPPRTASASGLSSDTSTFVHELSKSTRNEFSASLSSPKRKASIMSGHSHPETSKSGRHPRHALGEISYTRTGRISRAKKGLQGAHNCSCGKTYSRAEHLRRHQQNHGSTTPCKHSCGKTFHRQDLLQRHEEKCPAKSRQGSDASWHFPASSSSATVTMPVARSPTFASAAFLDPLAATAFGGASTSMAAPSISIPGTPLPEVSLAPSVCISVENPPPLGGESLLGGWNWNYTLPYGNDSYAPNLSSNPSSCAASMIEPWQSNYPSASMSPVSITSGQEQVWNSTEGSAYIPSSSVSPAPSVVTFPTTLPMDFPTPSAKSPQFTPDPLSWSGSMTHASPQHQHRQLPMVFPSPVFSPSPSLRPSSQFSPALPVAAWSYDGNRRGDGWDTGRASRRPSYA